MVSMLNRRDFGQLIAAAALAPTPLLAQGQQPLTRIAFGSCANQKSPQPIWDTVLAYRPDLFIFAGDNVYGDFKSADAAKLKQAYEDANRIPGLRKLRETIPHFAIWDDHDYGTSDGGVEFAHKSTARAEFFKFWNVPAGDPRREREGLYDSHIFGPAGMRVQIILLDTRWFRSPLKTGDQRDASGKKRYVPDPDPSKTMLGDRQWVWLAAELRKPAEVRLVVSSVQILAEGHGSECWGNLPLEKRKLLDTLRDSFANGVVLLSGDRHFGALYRETPTGLYPLTEVTSSGLNLTSSNAKDGGPDRFGAAFRASNFGTIEIDWRERRMALSVRDEGGNVRRSAALKTDELVATK